LPPHVVDLGGETTGRGPTSARRRGNSPPDRRTAAAEVSIRLEVVGKGEQTRGLERAALDLLQAEQILQVFRCPQRERPGLSAR
jgi:hypothetical protein